jgi:hypothetical protein
MDNCADVRGFGLLYSLADYGIVGIDPASSAPSPWWYHRAIAQSPRLQVQLRQDDLPKVLRTLSHVFPYKD